MALAWMCLDSATRTSSTSASSTVPPTSASTASPPLSWRKMFAWRTLPDVWYQIQMMGVVLTVVTGQYWRGGCVRECWTVRSTMEHVGSADRAISWRRTSAEIFQPVVKRWDNLMAFARNANKSTTMSVTTASTKTSPSPGATSTITLAPAFPASKASKYMKRSV